MIFEELQKIVQEEKARETRTLYMRNQLKEYLQVYVLYFIYTSRKYKKNLIFTGGTCLYHFYDLGRLSEDIDFDYLEKFDPKSLILDLKNFFTKKYKYEEVDISLKQKGRQILLKFPVLRKLNLAKMDESDLLYVKTDLSQNASSNYSIITTSKSRYGFNFVARHYDLPSLMAGKIAAILTRVRKKGKKDRKTIKGRDYFDLLWFLKKGVKPNTARLSDLLGKSHKVTDVKKALDSKIDDLVKKYKSDFKIDLLSVIKDSGFVSAYVENYQEEYLRFRDKSYSQ